MKKIMSLLLLSASFLCLACHKETNPDDGKVYLHKREGIKATISLDSRDQLDSVALYDDARIIVTNTGCHFCKQAKEYLDPYIEKTGTVIYEVDYRNVYKDAYEATNPESGASNISPSLIGLYPNRAKYGTPFYRFYANGKLQNTQASTAITEEFFQDRFNSYTKLTNYYQRNDFTYDASRDTNVLDNTEDYSFSENLDLLGFGTNRLDTLLEDNKKNKLVLFTWRRCNDCKNYRQKVLYPFLEKNPTQTIYFYETDGYRRFKRNEQEEYQNKGLKIWSDFCQKYHLSDYPRIDINGNLAGYTPTRVNFMLGGTYTLSVFANETDLVINDDRTLSYKTAFYKELTSIRSKTKLREDDQEGSSNYLKALKELLALVQDKDVELNKKYLESCI